MFFSDYRERLNPKKEEEHRELIFSGKFEEMLCKEIIEFRFTYGGLVYKYK